MRHFDGPEDIIDKIHALSALIGYWKERRLEDATSARQLYIGYKLDGLEAQRKHHVALLTEAEQK